MGGLRTALFALLLPAGLLLFACADADPKPPPATPQTVEQFFVALASGIHSDGEIYHARVETRWREAGAESLWATTEGWVAFDAEGARTTWTKGPGNQADLAARTIQIVTPDGVYSQNHDSDDLATFRPASEVEKCLPRGPSLALLSVACAFLPETGGIPGSRVAVETSSFEGRATVSLVVRYPVSSPLGSEEYPRGGPTPHPILTSATEGEFRLHIDPKTYRPIAVTTSVNSDPDRRVFGSVSRFESEFVPTSSIASDWFEPRSIGYVPPQEAEMRLLEDPALEAPVYWLGRSFDPGGGLPRLADLQVNSYGPQSFRSDAPNIQLGLAYRATGGFVRLDLFPLGDWEAFVGQLGGNFPWTWCSDAREISTADARITIRGAYESFPFDRMQGAISVSTPGQPPPAPTVPPLKTEPCPDTPRDRFMAEVRFKDATVVVNGTLSYGGQDGTAFGVFDTAEAMEAIGRGIHLRSPGQ
ncbi:MAG: hypothetical protein ABI577_16135 [bacterium]